MRAWKWLVAVILALLLWPMIWFQSDNVRRGYPAVQETAFGVVVGNELRSIAEDILVNVGGRKSKIRVGSPDHFGGPFAVAEFEKRRSYSLRGDGGISRHVHMHRISDRGIVFEANYLDAYYDLYIQSWRLTKVLRFNKQGENIIGIIGSKGRTQHFGALNIGPYLGLTYLARDRDSILRRLSCVLCFLDSAASVDGGLSGVEQRAPNQHYADSSEDNGRSSRYQHPESPPSHVSLGLQIGYFALFLSLTCYLVFLGYQVANSGFDALDRGQKLRGVVLFWGGILLACGCAAFIPYGGYWLAVESGWLVFLR